MRARTRPRLQQYDIPLKYQVRSWLTSQGRDQKWLAAKIGIAAPYLTQILAGQRTPSLRIAMRLEDVTGIPASAFCPEEDPRCLTSK